MTSGASMHAMIRTAPPQAGQVSMSILKTRLRRCADVVSCGVSNRPLSASDYRLKTAALLPALGRIETNAKRHRLGWRRHLPSFAGH